MAVLTTKERKALPAGKFAGPDRSYPIPDKAHAANAKARAAQFASPALKAKIDAKANRVLHAAGGEMGSPGIAVQTGQGGEWDQTKAAGSMPQPSSPGQAAVNAVRDAMKPKIKAAGGYAGGYAGGAACGLDGAMMAHADKMHPVGRR